MRRTQRSFLHVVSVAAGLIVAPIATHAQRTLVDDGQFIISRNGSRVGTESFQITSSATEAPYQVRAAHQIGARMVELVMNADSTGSPLFIQIIAKGGADTVQYLSGRTGNRLTTKVTTGKGDAATKEVLLTRGALLLDDDFFHPYYFLTLGGPRSASFVSPINSSQGAVTIQAQGLESVTMADGSATTGTHYVVARSPSDRRDVWISNGSNKLLKVEIPGKGLVAVRERLPR